MDIINAAIQNPTLYAILTGVLPTLAWLFFWLYRDRSKPEPFWFLLFCFLFGGLTVLFSALFQKITRGLLPKDAEIFLWAGIEEVLKFSVFYIIVAKSRFNDEIIDPAIYLITIALGFAALENTLYVLKLFDTFQATAGFLTGGLRFLGSTLLHVIASGFIGIAIGLAPKHTTFFFTLIGIAGATFLHGTFNLFIMNNNGASFLQVYGFLWVAGIISLLTLEKLRRIPKASQI